MSQFWVRRCGLSGRFRAVVSCSMVLVALVTGCSKSENGRRAASATSRATTTLPTPPSPPALLWAPCADVGESAECATLTVPLDYSHPNAKTISVVLSRIKATATDRLGVLLFNPGGPGISGLSLPADLVSQAAASPTDLAMFSRFDLIGFDPRGTGRSTAVDCGDPTASDQVDYSPETPDEMEALKTTMRAFAESCASRSGALLPFVGTINAARDLDQMRQALGEEQLNLFGFSYGTELFGAYADLFPKRVRTALLDGPVPSVDSGMGFFRGQADALEEQFGKFLERCSSRTDCALSASGVPAVVYDDVIARWDQKPPILPSGEPLTASQVSTVAANGTYGPGAERLVEAGIAQAAAGETSALEVGWNVYMDITPGKRSNAWAATVAINCADYRWPAAETMFADAVTSQEAADPRMGEAFLREYLPCAYWPFGGAAPHTRIAKGSPPILVVGTTNDPATPFAGAKALAGQLDNAVLLTRDGFGHTAWRRSACIRATAGTYLLTGATPAPGTICPSDT